MSTELQDRMTKISGGTQDPITQASLIISGIVSGNLTDPVVAQAIIDAQNTANTTNDASRWITGLLAEAAINGTFTTGTPGGGVSQAQLDAEALLRQTGDTLLGQAITVAVGSEATTRSSADTLLGQSVTAESNARFIAISGEAAARSSADTALDSRIAVIESVTRIVTTEAELLAALALGGDILIPGIDLYVDATVDPPVPGTRLRGLGRGNSRLILSNASTDLMVIHPSVADLTFCDLTISGGSNRMVGVGLDGASRQADRCTFERVLITSVSHGVQLTGAALSNPIDFLKDFTLRQSSILDFDGAGIYMNWEMLRLRLQDLLIWGNGAASVHNAIWVGNGMLDCHLTNLVLGNVGRTALEIFYPARPTALITTMNPQGVAVTVNGIVIAETLHYGASFAGCRRSSISGIVVRNTVGIGVEFIDDLPGACNLSVSGISVANTSGIGISVDLIKGFKGDKMVVDGVTASPGGHIGIQIRASDDVTIRNCYLKNAGPRYIQTVSGSTRINILGNEFVAAVGEDFSAAPEGGNFAVYFSGGDAYFNGNILRGNATNPLRSAYNGASVVTNPGNVPLPGAYDVNFVDLDNFRP